MIFLDTADLDEMRRYDPAGVIDGVTTNPTIMRRAVGEGEPFPVDRLEAIADLIAPKPLSVEVTSDDPVDMEAEARWLAGLRSNVCVKVPIHGVSGGVGNLALVRTLASAGIRTNVTAMYGAQQAYLAALSGATYVSLFAGRLSDQGLDPCTEIARLRRILDRDARGTQVIAASTRHAGNVVEWLDAGADIVTVTPPLLDRMLVHPGSREVVEAFLSDAKGLALGPQT